MRIAPFKAWFADEAIMASPASFSSDVKHHFNSYLDHGYFHRRKSKGYYIYEIEQQKNTFRGIVALLDTKDLEEAHVLPHENTLPQKEQNSMQTLLEREAMIKPILLMHPPQHELSRLMQKYCTSFKPIRHHNFKEQKTRHRIWHIEDANSIERITEIFAAMDKAYIADGHHRVSVMKRLARDQSAVHVNVGYILTTFLDFDNLRILDYNRLVQYSDSMSALELITRMSHFGVIHPMDEGAKPASKYEITFYMEGQWFSMKWSDTVLRMYDEKVVFDAQIVNDRVLQDILGIERVETDVRIKYIEGKHPTRHIEILVDRNPGSMGICLYPVLPGEVKIQADQHKILPPKSTYFEPRLPNGMITHLLTKLKHRGKNRS